MGTPIEVSAKTKDSEPQTIGYDFGDDLSEMTDKFGADTVFSNARAQMKIGLQAAMRRYIADGKDVTTLVGLWAPGVQLERKVDPIAAVKSAFANMSDEEKAAFLADLQAS
jgi:hypothetical protein